MRQNPGNARLPRHHDEVTVRLPDGVGPPAATQTPPPDGVTVLVAGAVLAPAPKPQGSGAGEGPVFVDDSGTRRRLLRLAGVLIALLSIGFIAIVGVALAVPDVGTSVGLGNVMPFIVPGGAVQPPAKALAAPTVQIAQPKPRATPAIVVTPTTEPEHVDVNPTMTSAPVTATTVTQASATVAPPTQAPVTQAPLTQPRAGTQTGGTPGQGGPSTVDANP